MNLERVEPADLSDIETSSAQWRFSRTDIDQVLTKLGLLTPGDLDSVVSLMSIRELGELPFEMRIGEWQIDLKAAVARSVINGVTLTSVLAAMNEASIPAAVLSVVVPLLFDLQRVELTPGDKYIYAVLLNAPSDHDTVEHWYARLPDRVRSELTEREFRDVVGRLEDAGAVETLSSGQVAVPIPKPRRLVRLALPAPPAQQDYPIR